MPFIRHTLDCYYVGCRRQPIFFPIPEETLYTARTRDFLSPTRDKRLGTGRAAPPDIYLSIIYLYISVHDVQKSGGEHSLTVGTYLPQVRWFVPATCLPGKVSNSERGGPRGTSHRLIAALVDGDGWVFVWSVSRELMDEPVALCIPRV